MLKSLNILTLSFFTIYGFKYGDSSARKSIRLQASTSSVNAADLIISTAFSIKPLFKMAAKKARDSMVDQGLQIGVDWEKNVADLQSSMNELQKEYDNVLSKDAKYPDYYLKPFHAYDDGNLSWQAALEVESAALTVHAPIFAEQAYGKRELRNDGDFMLRDNFHTNMKKMFDARSFTPTSILDLGCSTGLSTLKLKDSFPNARIIGLDLSPYYLAVANKQWKSIAMNDSDSINRIQYKHGAAENTGFTPGEVDMVTMSLVAHELPTQAFIDIASEAYRILPLGGAFAFMDMNPSSPIFQKFASNPFAFAAFKSTEPWIQQYVNTDIEIILQKIGFKYYGLLENSPRHRTIVAYK